MVQVFHHTRDSSLRHWECAGSPLELDSIITVSKQLPGSRVGELCSFSGSYVMRLLLMVTIDSRDIEAGQLPMKWPGSSSPGVIIHIDDTVVQK